MIAAALRRALRSSLQFSVPPILHPTPSVDFPHLHSPYTFLRLPFNHSSPSPYPNPVLVLLPNRLSSSVLTPQSPCLSSLAYAPRSPPLRRRPSLHWLRPPLRFPAVPIRSLWQLLGLESHVYRREPFLGDLPAQTGLQGRDHARGGQGTCSQDDEQDDGFDETGFGEM
jgi:hypothetical protein